MYGLDSPVLFYYSYCGKAPFYPGVENKSIMFLVYGIFAIARKCHSQTVTTSVLDCPSPQDTTVHNHMPRHKHDSPRRALACSLLSLLYLDQFFSALPNPGLPSPRTHKVLLGYPQNVCLFVQEYNVQLIKSALKLTIQQIISNHTATHCNSTS